MTTTNDITKLPKWARDEINNLRHNLEQREATIADLSKAKDAETAAVSWDNLHSRGALPDRAKVRFKTPEGHIDVSLRDGCLRIEGWRQIVVAPFTANVVKIFVQEVD